MATIISLGIFFGIPTIFLILFIINILKIIKNRKNGIPIKKSLIIKTSIFGVIFSFFVIFYIWITYLLSQVVVNM